MKRYRALPYTYCPDRGVVQTPELAAINRVTSDDPAASVMTDFRVSAPITIDISASLVETHDKMVAYGVRLLFAVDGQGLTPGVVVAQDMFGARPVRYVSRLGTQSQLAARDFLIPLSMLETVLMEDVLRSCVGNIVASLKLFGGQHLLVIEPQASGTPVIRGVFSATRIGRQLGQTVSVNEQRVICPLSASVFVEV